MHLSATDPISADFRARIDVQIETFLSAMGDRLRPVSPLLTTLTAVAADLSRGGKRIRPAFAYWGYVAAAGEAKVPDALWPAISAIELLHVGVLMHDDVLDAADTRRGRPSAHRQFETWHRERHGQGDAAEFGRAMAVLLGDQLLVWSGELAEYADLPEDAWRAARPYWHKVRTEVNSGQVLDVCAQYGIHADVHPDLAVVAARVLEEKTSRYTVQRPVQFGAAAAGGDAELLAALGRYGLALGRAFQLRDDLLGVFASEQQTGKPAAGDVREGKRTVLMAKTLARLNDLDRGELEAMLGRSDLDSTQVDRARTLIEGSGAVAEVEETISQDHAAALAALNQTPLREPGRVALIELARQCVQRDN